MLARRLVEVLIGAVLIGFVAYAIMTGSFRGGWRSYSRADEPWSFCGAVLINLAIGACFLFGATSWR
jgi:hypothetical protein